MLIIGIGKIHLVVLVLVVGNRLQERGEKHFVGDGKHNLVGLFVIINLLSSRINQKVRTMVGLLFENLALQAGAPLWTGGTALHEFVC